MVQAEYDYSFRGQQVVRHLTQAGQVLHAVHGPDGNRIAEYLWDPVAQASTLVREYVWMDGMAVGVVEGGVLHFVRTDHIGRPVFATDSAGTKVWEASYLPFGGVHVTTGTPIALRFPGQWFQSESGLHQNWMRDYDPTTGRYLQADPLGLVDGASVYGYGLQSPGRYVDPRGEEYKPGRTPPSSWPVPPESIAGKKPKWNVEGYWEGRGGKRLSWDDRSHGAGIDRGTGPQGGHWDDGQPGSSGERWDENGNPLPYFIPENGESCAGCEGPMISIPTLPVPDQRGVMAGFLAGAFFFCIWVFAG